MTLRPPRLTASSVKAWTIGAGRVSEKERTVAHTGQRHRAGPCDEAQGLLNGLEFLKAILEIAKDTVEAEKQTDLSVGT